MAPSAPGPLSALRWFTLDPAWIEQSAAFCDPDSRIGPAYLKVLLAAWRGLPAATVPASHRYLAQVTGLDLELVGHKYSELTEGFVLLADGRLHHVQMEKLALQMLDRYGRDIEEHGLAAAMAVQDPERFSLVAVESAKASTARGRRSLPRGFGFEMHPELRRWCESHGYPTPEDQDWAMEGFINHIQARNELAKDWAAKFKEWAQREIGFGRLPPSRRAGGQAGLPFGSARSSGAVFANLLSKGEVARNRNAALFNEAFQQPEARP
jgi:hypothetical protein